MLGLPGLIGQLLEDAIALARAEIQLAKARVFDRLRRSRTGIVLIVGAMAVALAGMIGLTVGLVMALAVLVGAAAAGAILFVACLAIAGLLGWLATRQFAAPAKPETEA